MESFFQLIKTALPLAIVSACLFGYVLHSQSRIFWEFEIALLSVQWMLLICIAAWSGCFIFQTFSLNDLPLIGLLLIAITAYFVGYPAASTATHAVILLVGVTLGRGVRFFLCGSSRYESALTEKSGIDQSRLMSAATFLIGLVVLLAFSSFWHLDMSANYYHGPRWMGLWNNPNIYGMFMNAGLMLATGLLTASPKPNAQCPKSREFLRIILFIAAAMVAVGLFFSYSRGAWLGTAGGLLYLLKTHGKFKWRYILPVVIVATVVVCFFWNATPDNAPWYVKRMDFGRPSAQHRVAAWKAGFEIMRDHPFGVGWNKAVAIYDKDYSPPEGGAAAITTNDYLMLGTQLGIPGLLCFVTYVALCFKSPKPKVQSPKSIESKDKSKETLDIGLETLDSAKSARADARPTAALDIEHWTLDATQVACRAAALSLLVAFWFDGGLFELPTATVFWILLELGKVSPPSRKVVVQPV